MDVSPSPTPIHAPFFDGPFLLSRTGLPLCPSCPSFVIMLWSTGITCSFSGVLQPCPFLPFQEGGWLALLSAFLRQDQVPPQGAARSWPLAHICTFTFPTLFLPCSCLIPFTFTLFFILFSLLNALSLSLLKLFWKNSPIVSSLIFSELT